jgi:hypothetical protein
VESLVPPEKPPRKEPPKLRLRQELYEEIDKVADAGRHEGLTRVGIVEEAVERWLRRRELGEEWEGRDPELTPLNAEERELVRAVLTMARTPSGKLEPMLLQMLRESYDAHHK